ncbi:MAG: Tol-Pal system beta propeller repeat protein TolB [Hyphomonadaceae bacterium]
MKDPIGMRFWKRSLALLALAISAAMSGAGLANAQLSTVVEGEQFIPIPVAVPGFKGGTAQANQIANQISEVVRNDLNTNARFQVLDAALVGPFSRDLDVSLPPRFADWASINTNALVVGNVSVNGSNMVTQFRVWDIYQQKELFAQQYTVPTPDSWRRVAHKVADDIYTTMTGEDGYFDSRIVFVSESGTGAAKRRRLAIMDQDGANAEHLLSGVNTVITPRFSPSSQTIIYSAYVPDPQNPRATLLRSYLYDIETGRQEVLADSRNATDFSGRFSPDGRYIVMNRVQNGNTDLYLIDVARRSQPPRRLTSNPDIDTEPSFSPDGSKIVFASDRSGPGESQLYIMNTDGSKMTCPIGGVAADACRISFGEGRYSKPEWSPRGDWIAFTKRSAGVWSIGVITPDGKAGPNGQAERILTRAYQDEGPTWSPNGRVIAFFREPGPGAGPSLWTIDLSGRNLRRLPTPGEGYASDPAWSPLLK